MEQSIYELYMEQVNPQDTREIVQAEDALTELLKLVDDRELRDAVMGLDEIYRMPILLFYVEGFSIREISRILQIPEGTVKSRLFAGRGKLREVLGEEVPV